MLSNSSVKMYFTLKTMSTSCKWCITPVIMTLWRTTDHNETDLWQNKAVRKRARHFFERQTMLSFSVLIIKWIFPNSHQDQWHCISGGIYFILVFTHTQTYTVPITNKVLNCSWFWKHINKITIDTVCISWLQTSVRSMDLSKLLLYKSKKGFKEGKVILIWKSHFTTRN